MSTHKHTHTQRHAHTHTPHSNELFGRMSNTELKIAMFLTNLGETIYM